MNTNESNDLPMVEHQWSVGYRQGPPTYLRFKFNLIKKNSEVGNLFEKIKSRSNSEAL